MDKQARYVFAHQLTNKTYKPGITIITPSGDRPEAIQRCRFYIERQTISNKVPLQWILSDDSTTPYTINTPSNIREFVHNKRQYPGNKSDSFRGNIITALPHVLFDKVVIIEDDDWYSERYLDIYWSRLEHYQLVGEGPARYYQVNNKSYRILGNSRRASFCQTALRSEIIDKLFVSCQKDSAFVDARLWDKSCRKLVFQDAAHCIGIKGLPGRKGIGIGHRSKTFTVDKDWKVLTDWIGKDADYYKKFTN